MSSEIIQVIYKKNEFNEIWQARHVTGYTVNCTKEDYGFWVLDTSRSRRWKCFLGFHKDVYYICGFGNICPHCKRHVMMDLGI